MKRILDAFARRTWAVVLVFALIGAGAGVLRTYLKEYDYSATATVYVTPPISSSASDALTADQYAANRTQLYLSLIKSPELARAVQDRLKVSNPADELAERVQAKATPLTSLLSITAEGSSPSDARSLASAYAESLASFAKTIEGSGGLRGSPSVVTVAYPVAKDPGFVQQYGLLLALTIGGALLGFLISYSYKRRFPNVGTADRLRRRLHIPLVETVDVAGPAQQLRRLEAELFTDAGNGGCLMVVGARFRDRATTFSELLAQSIEASGREVSDGEWSSAPTSRRRSVRSDEVAVIDVPALLESSASAATLGRSDCEEAVVVTRRNVTSVRDAEEVRDLLTMNNIAVRGVIILQRGRMGRRPRSEPPAERPTDTDGKFETPWPTIDVLEAEKRERRVRAD